MITPSRPLLMMILLMAAGCLRAQSPPTFVEHAAVPDFSKVEIKITRLADDFYTLEGVGGTRHFAKLGVLIFSRDQLRARLEHPAPGPDGSPGRSAPAGVLPVVTYDGPVTIHVNGEDVHLIPIRDAHTDGDTLVSFPGHDILAVGDYFRSTGYPYVDLNNGGSLKGLLAALDATIARAGPKTQIIPGHGPVVGRDALIKQRDMVLAVRDRVAALVSQGKSLEDVIAAKPTAAFDAQVPQSAETAQQFIWWIYTEAKAAPK